MINAESFKKKIKERTERLTEEISIHIQEVLKEELNKENVQVPFTVHLNSTCNDNIDIVRSVCNMLGFVSTVEQEHVGGLKITLNFTNILNSKLDKMSLSEMMRKVSSGDRPGSIGDYYQYFNSQV